MANFLRYANQGATRNRPLDDDLIKRLQYLEDLGVEMEVFSGGQPGKDEGGARVGSTRHDHGHSADAFFYKDGKKLDWANEQDRPIFEQIVSQGKANGVTGFGAGPKYMQPGSMHIGMGNAGVWGAGGKGDNAPEWLRTAYNGAPSGGKIDPIAEVVAAANPAAVAQNNNSILGNIVAKAQPTPETPKSNNGILVDAFNKITGKNFQMPQPPKEIAGIETGKFKNAFSGLGDLATAMAENDAQLNKQIQANVRGRDNSPVEFAFLSSQAPQLKKKKKGSLGGLGGYLI